MQEYQNSANYIITGKMLKVSYSGVYEDQEVQGPPERRVLRGGAAQSRHGLCGTV